MESRRYFSQDNQDRFLHEQVFGNLRQGVFVDVGAHDGMSLNNTLFFERELGWSGINVEPIPEVFQRLQETRPTCVNLNCAVSSTTGTAEFILNTGRAEMLSGLKQSFHPDHLKRVETEVAQYGGSSRVVQVATRRLEDILEENHIRQVHYLSIDVEGGEMDVIQSINFDKVFIDVIQFEANYSDSAKPIVDFLTSKRYVPIKQGGLDIFMIHQDSKFRKTGSSSSSRPPSISGNRSSVAFPVHRRPPQPINVRNTNKSSR